MKPRDKMIQRCRWYGMSQTVSIEVVDSLIENSKKICAEKNLDIKKYPYRPIDVLNSLLAEISMPIGNPY